MIWHVLINQLLILKKPYSKEKIVLHMKKILFNIGNIKSECKPKE